MTTHYVCDSCDAHAEGEPLPPGWAEHPRTEKVYCPDCAGLAEDDDPGYEPPNCYVPGDGWRVI